MDDVFANERPYRKTFSFIDENHSGNNVHEW